MDSAYIQKYMKAHPVDWDNGNKEAARRGGSGDLAGTTPTPAVQEFLSLLSQRRQLFTQDDYAQHCWRQPSWAEWIAHLPGQMRIGVKAKLYRNFYPSLMAQLHAWALLAEAGWFDICMMDAYDDALSKADLTLIKDGETKRLGLLGPTYRAAADREYKRIYRPGPDDEAVIEIQLPYERRPGPGNMRWHILDDFACIRPTEVRQPGLIGIQGRML